MSDDLWKICTDYYFPRRLEIRSQKTKKGYRLAINHFAEHLGRRPTPSDLDDDLFLVWVSTQLDSGQSVLTVRERMGRILTLWKFLADRKIVERRPTVRRPPAPDPTPIALTESQLESLFTACGAEPGTIAGIPAGLWWQAFLAFVFTTSERREAALSLRWDWIDFEFRTITIPPKFRKGGKQAGNYPLNAALIPLLDRIQLPRRDKVFPWDRCDESYYNHYGRILKRAGLPNDRKHKTHCLRVTHNTLAKILTGRHSPLLQHKSEQTSSRHYEDRRFTRIEPPPLPVPWKEHAGIIPLPAVEDRDAIIRRLRNELAEKDQRLSQLEAERSLWLENRAM